MRLLRRALAWGLVLGAAAGLAAWWFAGERGGGERTREAAGPAGTKGSGASSCRSCHPHEHETWLGSSHAHHGTPINAPDGGADLAVGSTWMQAYLRRDPQGWLRIVPVCWDMRDERWRSVPDVLAEISGEGPAMRAIAAASLETRSFDNDCSGCHASGTSLRFDHRTHRMETTWRDLAIDCEACHGDATDHAKGDARGRFARLQDLPPRAQVAVCGRCHGGPPTIGDFGPSDARDWIAILEDRGGVFADGTPSGQTYQVSSFVRSPCYRDGGLTCTGCHDAHGRDKRTPGGTDALCTGCHERHATREHTHHDPAGEGARCIECHMPRLLEGLTHHQRDHRIGSPLPALDGVPDACTACHEDKDKAWADEAYRRWWGEPPRATLDAVRAVTLARAGDRRADPLLREALRHPDPHFRAAATLLLGDEQPTSEDTEAEVRLAAVRAMERRADLTALRRALADPEPRIRGEAAAGLVRRGDPLPEEHGPDLLVLARHHRGKADAWQALARRAVGEGRIEEAVAMLEHVLALGPANADAWFLLAEVHDQLGQADALGDAVRNGVMAAGVAMLEGSESAADLERRVSAYVQSGRMRLAALLLRAAATHLPRADLRRHFAALNERFQAHAPPVR